MNIWKGLTPEQVWEQLLLAPNVAGPWQEHQTPTQRVAHIFVRRTIQSWRIHDMRDMGPPNTIAMVWGPITNSGEWIYKVPYHSRSVSSKEIALAKADELLRDMKWLLT